MKITNKAGVPESVYQFLCKSREFYDHDAAEGTISATTLLKPVQAVVLSERHDLEVEAMDLMWSVLGSGVHAVLEKVEGYQPVGRLYAEVGGQKISGKPDFIKGNQIADYKVTSAFSVMYGDKQEDWLKQLSIYRYLYRESDKKELDETGLIVAILRDWAERNTEKANYPKAPMVEIELNLWDFDKTEKFIKKRVQEIVENREYKDSDLKPCTDKERWYDERKEVYKNCEKYCIARSVCPQYNSERLFE